MNNSKYTKAFVINSLNVMVCIHCGDSGPINAFKTVDEGIYCCPHCGENGLLEDKETQIPVYCNQCGFEKEFRGVYQPYYASPFCFDCYMEEADNEIKKLEEQLKQAHKDNQLLDEAKYTAQQDDLEYFVKKEQNKLTIEKLEELKDNIIYTIQDIYYVNGKKKETNYIIEKKHLTEKINSMIKSLKVGKR